MGTNVRQFRTPDPDPEALTPMIPTPYRRERALIYIPHVDHRDASEVCCLAHCDERGYEVVALVHDDVDGTRWNDSVWPMFRGGAAEVLVVCSKALGSLAPNRRPRWEIAATTTEIRRPRIDPSP